jgi:UDP-glucuronate 4-epimerase
MKNKKTYKVLVTGCAGFIGFHVANKLIEKNYQVIGIDSLNNYYDRNLKKQRLKILKKNKKNFSFIKINLRNKFLLEKIFKKHYFDKVLHLAAQPGVRYSIVNPYSYINNNIVAFNNILHLSKNYKIKHFIYASSSSVYGANKKIPFSEKDSTDHPLQLYAATKKANELMAYSYSSLYKIPTTGIRFFTVYGPWGRPDMALFLFTKNILRKKPINLFNYGKHIRDFTYIDDAVDGVIKIINKIPGVEKKENHNDDFVPHRIVNIGSSKKIKLINYINAIELALKMKAIKNLLPKQKGDMNTTFSDTSLINKLVNYKSKTKINDGVKKFTKWFIEYYKHK